MTVVGAPRGGMVIVAFDLSLASTGVCHADGATHRIASPETGPRRLADLRDAVVACATAPWADLIVIEGQALGIARGNGSHHAELAGLHTLVRVALFERAMPYVDVPPASLKLYATGKGNSSKEAVHQAAISRLGFTSANRDEADALWLWTAAMDHYGHPTAKVPATHRNALKKIPWPTLEPLSIA